MDIIHFFDINGEYNQNMEAEGKNMLLKIDSPLKILELYAHSKNINIINKGEDTFKTGICLGGDSCYDMMTGFTFEIIHNFSVSHQNTLSSLGYIVFCNLANEFIFELLRKLIDYIKENCSLNIKTYIIGIILNRIDENRTEVKMNEFFEREDFNYKYYQIFFDEKSTVETLDKVFSEIIKEGKSNQNKTTRIIKDRTKQMNKLYKCLIF